MPDMPETVKLDEEVLAPMRHARTAAQRLMAGFEEALTIADMKRILGTQEESVLSMDRFFQLELHYLTHCAQPVMDSMIRTLVLEALPAKDRWEEYTIEGAMAEVDKLKAHPAVVASGSHLFKELGAVHQLLASLREGRAPTDQSVLRMSSWFRMVLSWCEHFLTHEYPARDKGKLFQHMVVATGRGAMKMKWAAFEASGAEGHTLKDVEAFRKFAWLLDQSQSERVNAIVGKNIRQLQEKYSLGLSICDKAGGSGGAEAGEGASSSSCTWKENDMQLAKELLSTKGSAKPSKEDAKAEAKTAQKAKLLALYRK